MTKRLIATGHDPQQQMCIWSRWDGEPLLASVNGSKPSKVDFTGLGHVAPVVRTYGDDAHIILPSPIIDTLLKGPDSGWDRMLSEG